MTSRLDGATLGDLRLLVAVVEEGSITGAARRLGFTVPTASRRLQQLEELIGVALVHRTTRKVFLTPDGELLVPLVKQIMARARDLADRLDRRDDGPAGTLRVSVPVLVAETILGGVVADLRARHPQLRLDVLVQNEHVDLMKAGVDVAIRITRGTASSEQRMRRIGTLSLILASAGAVEIQDVDALLDQPLLLAPIDVAALADALGVPEPRVRSAAHALVADRVALRDAVRAGAGIGLIPSLLGGGLVRVLPTFALPTGGVFAFSLPAMEGDQRLAAFVDAVRAALAGAPPA